MLPYTTLSFSDMKVGEGKDQAKKQTPGHNFV